MVSLRRSKLYRLLAGTNVLLPLSAYAEDGTLVPSYSHYYKYRSSTVHPMDLDESKQNKEDLEAKEKRNNQKANVPMVQESPVKRRKRHKRKSVQNEEACLMRGVYFKNMKWQAAIKVEKKQIHLGTVGSQEEAARLYDRAAFMCGREPNFELSESEQRELRNYSWDDFLAMTRRAINHKKGRKGFGKKSERAALENEDSEDNDLSGSEPEISDS